MGGYNGSEAIVSPGGTTYVQISFFNNAGFDWNLYANAIDFVYQGSEAFNANDLMSHYKTAIQAPINFLFMNVSVRIFYPKNVTSSTLTQRCLPTTDTSGVPALHHNQTLESEYRHSTSAGMHTHH